MNCSLSSEEIRHSGVILRGRPDGSRLNFLSSSSGIAITSATRTPGRTSLVDVIVNRSRGKPQDLRGLLDRDVSLHTREIYALIHGLSVWARTVL